MINGNINTNEINGNVITTMDIDATINTKINLDATLNPITSIGTDDYKKLINKPQINYVELVDNKTLDDLNVQVKGDYPDVALTNTDIENIIDNFAE